MKITVIAPDIPVLALNLALGKGIEEIKEAIEKVDVESQEFSDIIQNPALAKYIWVKFEKVEESLSLVNTALMVSGGNTHSFADRGVVITEKEVFINYATLKVVESISGSENKIDVMEAAKKMTILNDTAKLFDSVSFNVLYQDEAGVASMHMLSGVLSSDTWNILKSLGQVTVRDSVLSKGDGKEMIPGIGLFFGTSLMTVMYLDRESGKFAEHIREDFAKFPKSEEK